jgi:hypothetical protein
VRVPAGLTSTIDLSVFDAAYRSEGDLRSSTGDADINGSNQDFETEYRVFEQTNPLDFSARTPVFVGGSGNQSDNGCWWTVQQ